LERCALCKKEGGKLVRHHYRGRKAEPHLIMKVHEGACHRFGDFIVHLYNEAGKIELVTPSLVMYLYQRFVTLRQERDYVLPFYE
jgi:hypothetical protein